MLWKSHRIPLLLILLSSAFFATLFFSFRPFMAALCKPLYQWTAPAECNSLNINIVPQKAGFASGTPILNITSVANPFSKYYAEILRNEGFNSFAESDIAFLSSSLLAAYDVVILGEVPLTAHQIDILAKWVKGGGCLIAMRPDKKLAGLLGLTYQGAKMPNAYLLVNTSSGPGMGIVNETIQYHGEADLYHLNGAAPLAVLYSGAATATANPAVTLRKVGTKGGKAAAFTYDLAKSIIQTRQGNPDWSGQERDGIEPVRPNDMFYGAAKFDPKPDWVDPDKISIPQADEQQRLLANLIIRMNLDKKPLPRFWYFPRNLKAVVIMTGDDHGNGNGTGGTAGRFNSYIAMSPKGCSVENWECIRSTSYLFLNTSLAATQSLAYDSAGFEMAPHLDTNCAGWTPGLLESFFSNQLSAWNQKHAGLSAPVTNRNHCIAWSDYDSMPVIEHKNGVRLDTSYYYWPSAWAANSPGFFTGSGMPMRFADSGGNLVDVYQAATQMTDESGQSYPYTIDALLDKAIGGEGFYGAFTANIHTDVAELKESGMIVNSARSRGVPVIAARQMLKWLDGRNASGFSSVKWSGNVLSFSVAKAEGANGLIAMVPLANDKTVAKVRKNGKSVDFDIAKVKGISYARFMAGNGSFQVSYQKK